MRALPPIPERERGATTVMIGILAASLLAIGAFVVDWGALFYERRQLQNGADAAVLAVAEDCAYDLADCEANHDDVAQSLLDPNAQDDVTALEEVAIDPDEQTVRVVGTSLDPEGRSFVRFLFGRMLSDDEGKTVEAAATAQWGTIAAATTIPLAFHECEWDDATGFGGDLPSESLTIVFHNSGPASCAGGPANQNRPGNWGWLDAIDCAAQTSTGSWFDGSTGNSNPSTLGCDPSDFPIGEPILFPMFDQATGQGNNAEYRVIGYAAFELEAYKVHSSPNWSDPNGYRCPGTQGNQANCITGRFVAFVALDAEVGGPGDDDFGARAVALIK